MPTLRQSLIRAAAILSLGLGWLMIAPSPAAAQVCTVTSGVTTYPTANFCHTEPTAFEIIVFEIGLCPSAPTAPTTSSALDTTGCSPIFTSSTGATVSVTTGSSVSLSGTFYRPPNGSYSHGYVIIDNDFRVEANLEFATAQTGEVSGTGVYCATAPGGSTATFNTSICDTTPPTAGMIDAPLTDFDGGTGFSATASATYTGGSGASVTMDAYATDASGVLATSAAGVARTIGVQTFDVALSITAATTTGSFGINTTRGMSVIDNFGAVSFDGGPFLIEITVR